MRRLAASDVHGEGRRLVQALAKAEYDPAHDRLFLLGDYIDRGSDVKFTVELVRQLVKDGAIALKGNHDVMPRDAKDANGIAFWKQCNGGGETIRSYGGFPPEDVVTWLASLPCYHEEPDCLLVHAGFMPNVPLDEQTETDMTWVRGEFFNYYRGKRVIFGHTPTCNLHRKWEPWFNGDVVGIDTGAAYGGPLTLVDIDTWQTWIA